MGKSQSRVGGCQKGFPEETKLQQRSEGSGGNDQSWSRKSMGCKGTSTCKDPVAGGVCTFMRAENRAEQGSADARGASELPCPRQETEAQGVGPGLPSKYNWGRNQLCLFPLGNVSGRGRLGSGLQWRQLPSRSLPLSPTGPAAGGGHEALPRRAVLGPAAEHLCLLQNHLQQSEPTHLCSLLQ